MHAAMYEIDKIAGIILSDKRRHFILSRPIYHRFYPVSEADLLDLAMRKNFRFIVDLSRWLLLAGFGEIEGALIFRENSISVIEKEPLKGFVTFAESPSGYLFAYNAGGGAIYCISPSDNSYARIADNFPEFMWELTQYNYNIQDWINSLSFSAS